MYWDVNYFYGWAISQNLPIYGLEWVENTSQFYEDFINSCNGDSNIGYFLEVDVQYPEELHEFHNDFPFLQERMKIEKIEKLLRNLND